MSEKNSKNKSNKFPLCRLLEEIEVKFIGNKNILISDIAYDSRQVKKGSLFVALRGTNIDGHNFISEAIKKGAVAVLVEENPNLTTNNCTIAIVSNTRLALSYVSSSIMGHPTKSMKLIGITGTNGKTSTALMIESILKEAGYSVGSIGTISTRFNGIEEISNLTTPESRELQKTFARMRDYGIEYVVMEVSSHALKMNRIGTLCFSVAVFTNLTQDHLDFHKDMESYGNAKTLLFTKEYLKGTAVLNADDKYSARISKIVKSDGNKVIIYSRGKKNIKSDLMTENEKITLNNSNFYILNNGEHFKIELPLSGDFQIENALGAVGAALSIGIGWDFIKKGLNNCNFIPGRLELVDNSQPMVFIDYAHTPDAICSILKHIRPYVKGRLICVFGCTGDRDKSKRKLMAEGASMYSDYVIATSDDPRTEDPYEILKDIKSGLSGQYKIIENRREAIKNAIKIAKNNDIVVIAGKGHEKYQIIGTKYFPFDDKKIAKEALSKKNKRINKAQI